MRDYSMTGPDGQHAVATGLSNARWYTTPLPRAEIKALMKRSDRRALVDTAIYLGLMLGLGVVAVIVWVSWWSIPVFFAYGVLYGSAGDSRWHECGHGTAFRTPWLNSVVYQIACFTMMRDPTVWRWSHARHHTDTIIVGRDPEIAIQRPPSMPRFWLNFIGFYDVPLSLRQMALHATGRLSADEQTWIPASDWKSTVRCARVWTVIYVAMIALCVVTTSALPAMLIGLPRMYGAWHHVLTGMLQHGGLADNVTDHRRNTRTIRLNPVSGFIYWNMQYHVEHHMFPMVPYHALPSLHRAIADDLPPVCPGLVAGYRELLPALRRQRTDPEFVIDRPITSSSRTTEEAT